MLLVLIKNTPNLNFNLGTASKNSPYFKTIYVSKIH